MTSFPVAYGNEAGDIWIERGSAPWPRIQHEAKASAWFEWADDGVLRYEGIEEDVRVSDEREFPHLEPEDCPGCCRTIVAHHFRMEER